MSWIDEVKADGVEFPTVVEDDWKLFDKSMPIKRWIIRAHDDDLVTLFVPRFPYATGELGRLMVRVLTMAGSYVSKLNVPAPGTIHVSSNEIPFPIKTIDYNKVEVNLGFAGTQILLQPKGGAIAATGDKLDRILLVCQEILAKLKTEETQ